jgi:hypothetical protein
MPLAIALSLTAGVALADAVATPSAAATTPPTQPPAATTAPKAFKAGKLSCEQFLLYDDVTRPQIVFWSEGAVHKGKPGEEVIDVDRTNTLVPILVDECTRTPKSSFWHKFKAESKKIPPGARTK